MIDEYALELVKQEKYDEGWDHGRQEGLNEGCEQEKRRLAQQMLNQGLPVESIIQLTGLTPTEIQ